jgi:DDE superfamily endonuclease
MPKNTEKQRMLMEIENNINMAQMCNDTTMHNDLLQLYANVYNARYLDRGVYTWRSKIDASDAFFAKLSRAEFLQTIRVREESLDNLVREFQNHPVFQSKGTRQQAPLRFQFALVLSRLGQYGTGQSRGQIAVKFGVSWGAVNLFTDRVIEALLGVHKQWVNWPTDDEKEKTKSALRKDGFPGCVGFIDGTLIEIFQRPGTDGEAYFDRKKNYSLNMQVVVNQDKRIIGYFLGTSGSWHDARVFKRMGLSVTPEKFFKEGEYLIGDSAYTSSKHMVIPFKGPDAKPPENTRFNNLLAQTRVRNEHAIGLMKNRWGSLKEIRTTVNKPKDMRRACRWVMACVVLHNMMQVFRDSWEEEQQRMEASALLNNDNHEENMERNKEVEVVYERMEREREQMSYIGLSEGAKFREMVKQKAIGICGLHP